MQVAIWDIEWYYAKNKTNVINTDAMKISSYHKQIGDQVFLVESEFDIKRKWGLMYILKSTIDSPSPPLSLTLNNPKVKLIGKGFIKKKTEKIGAVIAGCRPDYTLYPNMTRLDNTRLERSEYWQFFDSNGNFLPLTQDASREEKNNFLVVTDKNFWSVDNEKILKVFSIIKETGKKITFSEPIWLDKILHDKVIRQEFLSLKIGYKNGIKFTQLKDELVDDFCIFFMEFKRLHKNVTFEPIRVEFSYRPESHWYSREWALWDFKRLINVFKKMYAVGAAITITFPCPADTPYFPLFQNLSDFSRASSEDCWLEFLTFRYHPYLRRNRESLFSFWLSPEKWNEEFRDLIRQTCDDKVFCTIRRGSTNFNEDRVPWDFWKQIFKYGL